MQIGDIVPDFSLRDQHGKERRLYGDLQSGPAVIFFYPAAMTKGCTLETVHFRDLERDFARLGVTRLGISRDSVERQLRFSSENHFNFPLLSDVDGVVAELFGVRRTFGPLPVKRWTFVLDAQHRVIDIIKSETRMRAHGDMALKRLEEHAPSTPQDGHEAGRGE